MKRSNTFFNCLEFQIALIPLLSLLMFCECLRFVGKSIVSSSNKSIVSSSNKSKLYAFLIYSKAITDGFKLLFSLGLVFFFSFFKFFFVVVGFFIYFLFTFSPSFLFSHLKSSLGNMLPTSDLAPKIYLQ